MDELDVLQEMETITPSVDANHPLCGVWRVEGEDTDEYYRAEYSIRAVDGQFQVDAVDRSDEEEFEISDVKWNGVTLEFHSYVSSTERCGISQMRYLGDGKVEFLFTFTVKEIWARCLSCSNENKEAEQNSASNFSSADASEK